MTYTPGPWSVVPSPPQEGFNCYWIEVESRSNIAVVHGPQSSVEALANARLIAAAPDLLYVCSILVRLVQLKIAGDQPDEITTALAAIAKATGA